MYLGVPLRDTVLYCLLYCIDFNGNLCQAVGCATPYYSNRKDSIYSPLRISRANHVIVSKCYVDYKCILNDRYQGKCISSDRYQEKCI